MRKAIAALLVLAGCAGEPSSEERALEGRDLGRVAPNGLPLVEAEILPYAAPEVSSAPEKASIEPFLCTDELGGNCRRPRSSWTSTDIRPSQRHTITGIGPNNGYAFYRFMVRNTRNQWYRFESHPSTGSVGWWFDFPGVQAQFDICLVGGTNNPRCITTNLSRGSTFAFHNESWSPYETLTFEIFVTGVSGTVPSQATFEQLLLLHNDITL